nr:hypothetical protein [Candidatus Erwinia dacicola]
MALTILPNLHHVLRLYLTGTSWWRIKISTWWMPKRWCVLRKKPG